MHSRFAVHRTRKNKYLASDQDEIAFFNETVRWRHQACFDVRIAIAFAVPKSGLLFGNATI